MEKIVQIKRLKIDWPLNQVARIFKFLQHHTGKTSLDCSDAKLILITEMNLPMPRPNHVFDAEHVKLADIEGSPADKCGMHATNMVDDYLLPLVNLGKEGFEITKRACKVAVETLEAASSVEGLDEQYTDAMCEVSNLLRGVQTVHEPFKVDAINTAKQVCGFVAEDVDEGDISPLIREVRDVLPQLEDYKPLCDDLVSHIDQTKKMMPTIKAIQRGTKGKPSIDNVVVLLDKYETLLNPPVREQARMSLVVDLSSAIFSQCKDFKDHAVKATLGTASEADMKV